MSSSAVSYTHLDVYKRQAMERLGEIVQALGQAQTHAEAAETAFLFQHELALALSLIHI